METWSGRGFLGSTMETWSGRGFLGPILPVGSQGTLSQHNVSAGCVDVVVARITTVDHQSINKLHCFGSLSTKFSRHNDLATLGTRFHNETEDTITSTTHSQTSDKLITKGFSLSNGAKSTGCYFLGVQIN